MTRAHGDHTGMETYCPGLMGSKGLNKLLNINLTPLLVSNYKEVSFNGFFRSLL